MKKDLPTDRRFAKIILNFVLLFTIFGCSSQVETTTSEPTIETSATKPTSAIETASPTPDVAAFQSPISPISTGQLSAVTTPTRVPPTGAPPTITIPQPEPGQGIVHGRLLRPDNSPYVETAVRLGNIVWSPGQEGVDGFVAADRNRSPQSVTDTWGNFIIEDVPPGDYGLAVDNPDLASATAYVPNETGDKILVITIDPNGVIDLKEIKISFE